jgi:hypothetical protein
MGTLILQKDEILCCPSGTRKKSTYMASEE